MANLTTKFAVADYGNIQSLIEQGLLSYPTYVFCRDKNTMVFIDKNAQIQDVKGFNQSSVIEVEELPTEDIQSNTFYICNGIGYLLINNILVPVFKEISESIGVSSYDDLSEVPLVNKKGTIVLPIVLSDLSTGCYSVSGQYRIGGNLTTTYVPSTNVIILVELDNEYKYITRIDGKKVVVYTVKLETMEVDSDEYVTQSWVQAQGYTTKDYVNQAIEDLYNKIMSETLVSITKVSQLENDIGYLTNSDMNEISDEIIANLFSI